MEHGELVEPTDEELLGLWPDPFSGAPDGGTGEWLAGLSAAELDAVFSPDDVLTHDPDIHLDSADASAFAAGGVLDSMEPGLALAGFAHDAYSSGLGRLSDDELVGLLGASRRLVSWQAAVELRAVSELDARRRRDAARPGWSRTGESISAELAAALTLTGRSADALLGLSRELARIPTVLAALYAGRIDRARAEVFASELAALGDVAACAIAAAFVRLAGSMTTGQLRAALRAMVLAIDPEALRRRAEKGQEEARLERWQEHSGNAALTGRELPAAEVIAADRRIAAIARALKEAGAPGSMDQLRAAVFTALLTGRDPETLVPAPPDDLGSEPATPASAGSAATHRPPGLGQPPGLGLSALTGSVNLTMPVSTWLGLSDVPGEAAAPGPLDAATCRELAARLAAAAATRWCVTLTGEDGRVVAHACSRDGPGAAPGSRPGTGGSRAHRSAASGFGGSGFLGSEWIAGQTFTWLERGACAHTRQERGYRPSHPLREIIKVRQRTCGFPGCRRPARSCDDDHTIPYESGGRTCECNLSPLCRYHHRVKQAAGWSLVQTEPGLLAWTTPHGRTYTVVPDPYPV